MLYSEKLRRQEKTKLVEEKRQSKQEEHQELFLETKIHSYTYTLHTRNEDKIIWQELNIRHACSVESGWRIWDICFPLSPRSRRSHKHRLWRITPITRAHEEKTKRDKNLPVIQYTTYTLP